MPEEMRVDAATTSSVIMRGVDTRRNKGRCGKDLLNKFDSYGVCTLKNSIYATII